MYSHCILQLKHVIKVIKFYYKNMEAQKGGVSKLQQLSSLSLPQLEHMKNQLEEVRKQDVYRVIGHRCIFFL